MYVIPVDDPEKFLHFSILIVYLMFGIREIQCTKKKKASAKVFLAIRFDTSQAFLICLDILCINDDDTKI